MPAYSRILLPWDSQPQEAVGVDLRLGADFSWNAATPRFAFGSLISSGTTAPQILPTSGGLAISNGYLRVATPPASLGGTTWTQVGSIWWDGVNSVTTLSARNTGQAVRFTTSTNVNCVMWGVADVNITIPSLAVGVHHYVVRRVGNTHSVFVNGRLAGTSSSASTPMAVGATAAAIGALAGGGPEDGISPLTSTNGVLSVTQTARALTDAECLFYSANPWSLFAPRAIWVPVSAATGGAYTLTADAGAYAIGGQDAALVKSRIVVADAGAYSLSGQDAALKVGHVLIADAGAYTISGQDAALLRGRVVTADAGAYALAGQDATLTYVPTAGAYTLTAEAGAYTLNGQDAALIRGRVVSADAGAYALAGQDATLTYALANAYTLTCEAGAYSLNGQDATFAFSGAATPVAATGGGIYPTPRRKTKQEIDEDRKRLGILPDEPEVQTGIVETPKRPTITLAQLIGKPAADTHRADMERASAAHKLRKRRQDDDLLMMM